MLKKIKEVTFDYVSAKQRLVLSNVLSKISEVEGDSIVSRR